MKRFRLVDGRRRYLKRENQTGVAVFFAQIGVTKFDDFEVEVVDPVGDYKALLKEVRVTKLRSCVNFIFFKHGPPLEDKG